MGPKGRQAPVPIAGALSAMHHAVDSCGQLQEPVNCFTYRCSCRHAWDRCYGGNSPYGNVTVKVVVLRRNVQHGRHQTDI